jgi:hypothetical protein
MKIPVVRAELFNADGRTDGRADRHDGANSIRNLANAPKNGYVTILVKETLRCNSTLIHSNCRGHRKYVQLTALRS